MLSFKFLNLVLAVTVSIHSVLLADSSGRRCIVLDTGQELTGDPFVDLPQLTEDEAPAPEDVFGGTIHLLERLPDGTVRVVVAGDFLLGADDTFRGVGAFPVVVEVGNDVTIANGAIIDFSGIGLISGAGGGSAGEGGRAGGGGVGGEGGGSGKGGRGGSGGLIVGASLGFVPISFTTPGLPAKEGSDGFEGEAGGIGMEGRQGHAGKSPLLAAGSFGGEGGGNSSAIPCIPATNMGAGGAKAFYPPPIYYSNSDLRNLLYNVPFDLFEGKMTVPEFENTYYRGGDSFPGDLGTSQPAVLPDGFGKAGGGGRHPSTSVGLVGGGGGGSGGGGSGGPGGQGGGGGGGGSGGQGEWAEPIPTNAVDLGTSAIDYSVGRLLEVVIETYVKNARKQNALLKVLKIPSVDVGAGGGDGGKGGDGGRGSDGGDGGGGGDGGAGGGALKIEALGRITIAGGVYADGADGAGGGDGSPAETNAGLGKSGALAGDTKSGWGMSDVFGFFGNLVGGLAGPEKDLAGDGFGGKAGGNGGVGGSGYPGGKGGGGAGGTLIFSGTEVIGGSSGNRRIRINGGNLDESPPSVIGENGKILLSTNSVESGSDVVTTLAALGFTVEGTPSPATTTTAALAGNPFIAGSPGTPTIAGLPGGAEAFGGTGFLTTNLEATVDESGSEPVVTLPLPDDLGTFPSLLQELVDPAVVLGAMRVDRGPRTYSGGPLPFPDYPGYDVVLVFNARGTSLGDVHFGCNVQPLDANGDPVLDGNLRAAPFHSSFVQEGGWTRDPKFGGTGDDLNGILTGYEIYAFLVPEDPTDGSSTLNFYLSATDDSNPSDIRRYTLQTEIFKNGDYLEAAFDPGNVTIEDATWTGGSSGNWGDETNWTTAAFPNNSTSLAYEVIINLPGSTATTVAQDQQVIIDRLEIGANTTINILDNRSLTIEKFDIRPNAGVILNNGQINVNSSGSLTNLFFTGSSISLEGNGSLTTSRNPNNIISGIRSTDSLVHGLDHTIRATGQLGNDQLRITNYGTIETQGTVLNNDNLLVIDPSGTSSDVSPGFLNEGILRMTGITNELRLADGFFENRGTLERDSFSPLLSFHDARYLGNHETFGSSSAPANLYVTGTTRLEQVDIDLSPGGNWLIENADLRMNGAEVMLADSSNSSNKPLIIRDSALDGANFTFDFTPDVETIVCGKNYGEYSGTGEAFEIIAEGSHVALSNISLEGSFCYDREVIVANQYGAFPAYFDDLPYNGFTSYLVPEDLITVRANADSFTLGGSIVNNGVVDFSGSGIAPTPVAVDGNIILSGTGGWLGRQRYFPANSGVLDRLEIGAGQTLVEAGFDGVSEGDISARTASLLLSNEGDLLKMSMNYEHSLFTGLNSSTIGPALDAVLEPLVLVNRGVVEPNATFGGGFVDNEGGILAVGDYPIDFENVRISGGEVVLHHFKRNWMIEDFESVDPGAEPMGAFNAVFEDVVFGASNFLPFAIGSGYSLDVFANPGSIGFIEMGAANFDTGTTVVNNDTNLFRNITAKTHMSFPEATFRGRLNVDPGVALVFKYATLGEDFSIHLTGDDPSLEGGLFFGGVQGEPGSSLTIGADVPFFLDGDLSGLELLNEGRIQPFPINDFSMDILGEVLGEMLLAPGGGSGQAAGMRNRGVITNVSVEDETSVLTIAGGHLDNRGGEILLAGQNFLENTLIEGGEIRAADGHSPAFLEPVSSSSGSGLSILRDLRLVDIELVLFDGTSDLLLDGVEIVKSSGGPQNSLDYPISIQGAVTLTGDGQAGVDFFFVEVPQLLNPAQDQLVITAGTEVEIRQFTGDDAISSLTNEGVLSAPELLIRTPLVGTGTFLNYQTTEVGAPDAPLGETVTLESLGFTSDMEVQDASRVINRGTIKDSSGGNQVLGIQEALLDNEGGLVDFLDVAIADALIQNTNGTIRARNSMEIHNGVVIGGLLNSPSVTIADQFIGRFAGQPDGDELFDESITSMQDVTVAASLIDLQEATWFCVGTINASSAAMTSTGVLSVTGQDSTLALMSLQNDGVLSLNGATLTITNGLSGSGDVIGSGTLDVGTSLQINGTLAPGFSAGKLTFLDDLALSATSVLAFEIGGSSPGFEYDLLNIETTASLSLEGSIEVSLIDDFVPAFSDTFAVLTTDHPILGGVGFAPSGSRIATPEGGSIEIHYGASSPFGANDLVLANYLPYQVVFVAAGATGAGNGSNWLDAFTSLQDGIANVPTGWAVHVAAGSYHPDEGAGQTNDLRTSTFQLVNDLEILGGFPAAGGEPKERDPSVHLAILSGDLQQNDPAQTDNAFHVVTGTGTNATAVLDGFVICDGFASQTSGRHHIGAGILCDFSGSPTFRNLVVTDNEASLVGGGSYLNAASPTFTHVSFESNRAPNSGSGVAGEGGAIYFNSSNVSFTNCRFVGNEAQDSGGALSLHASTVSLTNVLFSGNDSNGSGGAIYVVSSSSLNLVNGTFGGNRCAGIGGGLYLNSSSPSNIENTIVWDNEDGSGTVSPTNSASVVAGTVTFSNSLVANSGGSGSWASGLGVDGVGNLDGDPLFVAGVSPVSAPTPAGDYRLSSGSLALDAGIGGANAQATDLAGMARVFGSMIDLGAYEGSYSSFALLYPSLDPLDDANANGLSSFLDYAGGANPSQPSGPILTASSDRFTSRQRPHATDLERNFEASLDLANFETLVEGYDYEVLEVRELSADQIEIDWRLLDPWLGEGKVFVRESVGEAVSP